MKIYKFIFGYLGLLILFCSQAKSDSIQNIFHNPSLQVSLESTESDNFKLQITSEQKINDINYFFLENPPRLVVDLPGIIIRHSDQAEVKNLPISTMRLGVHPDKTRLVLDFQQGFLGKSVNHKIQKNVLEITFSLAPPPQITSRENLTEDTIAQNNIDQSKEPLTESSKPENSKTELDNPPLKEIGKESLSESIDNLATLKQISFQEANDKETYSAIIFDVNNLHNYTLKQSAADCYDLILEQAKLVGVHLLRPQFPPDTFPSIDTIVTTETSDKIIIKIYLEDQAKLSPYIAQGQLWIKVNTR